MKAEIDAVGTLTITPDTPAEAYALRCRSRIVLSINYNAPLPPCAEEDHNFPTHSPPPPPPTLAQARAADLATLGNGGAVSDLARTLLPLRARVPDRVLLDCLDLGDFLAPGSVVNTRELQDRWICSQPWVSRRMAALRAHLLLDATRRTGPGAYWVIKRLGPVA